MPMILSIIAAVLLIAGGGVFLISQRAPASSSPQPITTAFEQTATAAPDFSLEKVGGGRVTLADYKGKKAVVLDFWATWCPNCWRDIPHLDAFYQKYKDQVEVIGINLHEDPSAVARFVSDNAKHMTFPVALDPNSSVARAYNIGYTNTHVLIDKNGDIIKTVPGDISEQDFLSLLDS